jgi:bacillithiol system protein YtxJ
MKRLDNIAQLEEIVQASALKPQLIFKHSTRCSISAAAKYRLEADHLLLENNANLYFLDLLLHRDISSEIAQTFGVRHESPQIILVYEGKSVLDLSHYDIEPDAIMEAVKKLRGTPNTN